MKITKYFLSMAAALGVIAGCQKPEMIQIAAPEDVKAPVLEKLQGPIEITPDNLGLEKVVFTWSAADYGVQTQVNYALEATNAAGAKATITSGITVTSAEVTYETLNAILFNDLKLTDGIAEDVTFIVSSKVGEYAAVYSNAITVSCKVTAAEKEYPKLTVAGSYAYNSWTPGKGQYVFDFDGTDAKYSGIIDFGEDVSALNFKFVGSKWGENEFSVPSGEAQAAEAAELPLVAGGGDNIAAYTTHRYYNLTLDKAAPKVIKNFSFNSLGVIGDATATGWDADTDMAFNPEKQRFYVDMTLADGTIKFRANDAWDVNWGGADGVLVSGGDNIAVTAGNYRIYVNLNNPANPVYELNASMYGQTEESGSTEPEDPVEPEVPEPLVGWGIVGGFTGWADGADVMLASDGTYLVAKGIELEGELKFRKDGAWGTNLGLAEGEFAADTELALVQDGANINVTAGTYDVYLDEVNAKAWFITDGSYPGGGAAPETSEWGVVGQVNGWAAPDVTMYKTATEGLFVAYNVAMPDGGFKIRANGEWNDAANYGLEKAGPVEVDHWYPVISAGSSGDMTLVAGNYDIWFDLTASKVYVMTPGKDISEAVEGLAGGSEEPEPTQEEWYLVGNFNGWTAGDANYKMTLEGDWYVFKGFTADGQGVKLNNGTWDVNRGGTFVAANEAIAVEHNGSDMMVAAGTYDVYLSKDATTLYFMTPGEVPAAPLTGTWYLVGNFNGWTAGDANYLMTIEDGWYVFKNFTADGQGVKLNNGTWDVNRGGTFVAANEAIAVEHNGSDMMVAAGTYDVYLNGAEDTLYFMEPGTVPAE